MDVQSVFGFMAFLARQNDFLSQVERAGGLAAPNQPPPKTPATCKQARRTQNHESVNAAKLLNPAFSPYANLKPQSPTLNLKTTKGPSDQVTKHQREFLWPDSELPSPWRSADPTARRPEPVN